MASALQIKPVSGKRSSWISTGRGKPRKREHRSSKAA
jgi:hypothetical protein